MKPHHERMAELSERIPDAYQDIFEELVGQGLSPLVVGAAIQYVEEPVSQTEAAREWDASEVSIRSAYPAVLALSNRDGVETGVSKERAVDIAGEIAEALGWELGEHYTVNGGEGYSTPQPNILKPGLVSIRDAVVDGE